MISHQGMSALLTRLHANGVAARAAYRDPHTTAQVITSGGQAVTIDLTMPDTIGAALDGREAVFLLGATSPAQTTHELNML